MFKNYAYDGSIKRQAAKKAAENDSSNKTGAGYDEFEEVLQQQAHVIIDDPDARYNAGIALGDPESADIRIVALGYAQSGNSSLMLRLLYDTYDDEPEDNTLLQWDQHQMNYTFADANSYDEVLRISYFDLKGFDDILSKSEVSARIADVINHSFNVILLYYSIDNRTSFEDDNGYSVQDLKLIVDRYLQLIDSSKFMLLLVGLKLDEDDYREVSTTEAANIAKSWGHVPFIEVSAKTAENAKELLDIICSIYTRRFEVIDGDLNDAAAFDEDTFTQKTVIKEDEEYEEYKEPEPRDIAPCYSVISDDRTDGDEDDDVEEPQIEVVANPKTEDTDREKHTAEKETAQGKEKETKPKKKTSILETFAHLNIDPSKLKVGATPDKSEGKAKERDEDGLNQSATFKAPQIKKERRKRTRKRVDLDKVDDDTKSWNDDDDDKGKYEDTDKGEIKSKNAPSDDVTEIKTKAEEHVKDDDDVRSEPKRESIKKKEKIDKKKKDTKAEPHKTTPKDKKHKKDRKPSKKKPLETDDIPIKIKTKMETKPPKKKKKEKTAKPKKKSPKKETISTPKTRKDPEPKQKSKRKKEKTETKSKEKPKKEGKIKKDKKSKTATKPKKQTEKPKKKKIETEQKKELKQKPNKDITPKKKKLKLKQETSDKKPIKKRKKEQTEKKPLDREVKRVKYIPPSIIPSDDDADQTQKDTKEEIKPQSPQDAQPPLVSSPERRGLEDKNGKKTLIPDIPSPRKEKPDEDDDTKFETETEPLKEEQDNKDTKIASETKPIKEKEIQTRQNKPKDDDIEIESKDEVEPEFEQIPTIEDKKDMKPVEFVETKDDMKVIADDKPSAPSTEPLDSDLIDNYEEKIEEATEVKPTKRFRKKTVVVPPVIERLIVSPKRPRPQNAGFSKKTMSVNEFKSVPLNVLIENDDSLKDNYDIAKKICQFYDGQFGDKDTVTMVAQAGKQPAISYWVKGDYVRKEKNINGKHVLVYRACRHRECKKPKVPRSEFEQFVKRISLDYEEFSVNKICDMMDEKFGDGCHYARSTTKRASYDIYSRFSDKYDCGFKLPSGSYIIAWRR